MKRILITGVNSYLGKCFDNYINRFDGYETMCISMRDEAWKDYDLTGFDTVYHVAGIAHADSGRISPERAQQYYHVNTDLTLELAKKAKADGVRQFIFMSSAIVYGDSAPVGERRVIAKSTVCSPASAYGDSKVQAEEGLKKLDDDKFRVVILRPPMIYGPGCKGNYPVLSYMARKLPFFPAIDNERSMLFVGNLTEFVKLMIDNDERGTFFPQNGEYSNTSQMVKMIAQAHGKDLKLINHLTWAVKFLRHFTPLADKAFGSLSYDMAMSEYPKGNYRKYSLEESIKLTEENT